NSKLLNELYGKHYADLEKLFLAAKTQPMTQRQQKRFQLIEDNMIVLQWRLRNAGFLPVNFQSTLQRSDSQINQLLHQKNGAFEYFPEAIIGWKHWNIGRLPEINVQMVDHLTSQSEKSTI